MHARDSRFIDTQRLDVSNILSPRAPLSAKVYPSFPSLLRLAMTHEQTHEILFLPSTKTSTSSPGVTLTHSSASSSQNRGTEPPVSLLVPARHCLRSRGWMDACLSSSRVWTDSQVLTECFSPAGVLPLCRAWNTEKHKRAEGRGAEQGCSTQFPRTTTSRSYGKPAAARASYVNRIANQGQ